MQWFAKSISRGKAGKKFEFKRLLIFVWALALSGCQVYQFDPNSVSAENPGSYTTGTVPFTIVGEERPDWLVPESPDAPEVMVTSYCQIWCMTIRQRSCQIDPPPVFHPETARCPRPASVG